MRIAAAVVLDSTAFVIWNVGTRSPAALIAAIRAGMRVRASFTRGLLRFTAGALAILNAVWISLPIAVRPNDETIVECLTIVTALLIEQLVGPKLRARLR